MPNVEVHSVFDSASLVRQRKQAEIEAKRQLERELYIEKISECRFARSNKPEDWVEAGGRAKVTSLFEAELSKICPQLRFVPWSISAETSKRLGLGEKPTPTRAVMWDRRDPKTGHTEQVYCGGYLYPVAQEYDILIAKKVVGPMLDPKTGFLNRHFDGKTPDPTKYDLNNPVFEGEDLALVEGAEQYIAEPENRIPGWRSVLARLVGLEAITPTQAETFFPPGDRLSWAVHMGRRNAELPF